MVLTEPRRCGWCRELLSATARKYYRDEATFAGEVDHAALIARLVTYDGWALSTSAKALRTLLPLCPPATRVAPWIKPHGVSSKTRGAHNAWEAVLFVPARRRSPGFPDYLIAHPARHGGTLPGRKPRRFWAFLFQLLGAAPQDSFDDLFEGTGGGRRHWQAVAAGVSPPGPGDACACAVEHGDMSDCPIHPFESTGPVFDEAGNVVVDLTTVRGIRITGKIER